MPITAASPSAAQRVRPACRCRSRPITRGWIPPRHNRYRPSRPTRRAAARRAAARPGPAGRRCACGTLIATDCWFSGVGCSRLSTSRTQAAQPGQPERHAEDDQQFELVTALLVREAGGSRARRPASSLTLPLGQERAADQPAQLGGELGRRADRLGRTRSARRGRRIAASTRSRSPKRSRPSGRTCPPRSSSGRCLGEPADHVAVRQLQVPQPVVLAAAERVRRGRSRTAPAGIEHGALGVGEHQRRRRQPQHRTRRARRRAAGGSGRVSATARTAVAGLVRRRARAASR